MHSKQAFEQDGYIVCKQLFSLQEIAELKKVVECFHLAWLNDNQEFYRSRAVNSAYLTRPDYLDETQRLRLFEFISSNKILPLVNLLLSTYPCFMNTQLFFDPFNPQQNNYWHRDLQYHLNIDEQKQALQGAQVLHFRVPLCEERGIELVPGSHQRWDSDEELQVRLEQNGCKNHQDISTGQVIPLDAGDLLIFSANMLHRGLYGTGRMTLDILFCDPEPQIVKFIRSDCLPDDAMLHKLSDPSIFINSLNTQT